MDRVIDQTTVDPATAVLTRLADGLGHLRLPWGRPPPTLRAFMAARLIGRTMKRVVVISGATGTGKSETLRSMRETLIEVVGEIAALESDQFYMMIDPHWTCPPDRVDRYYAVSGWLLQQTALGFMRSGFDWVAIASNGHWTEHSARKFVQPFLLEDASVHHITLDPGEDILRQRIAQRSKAAGPAVEAQQAAEAVHMLRQVRQALGTWTHVVDNSQLTPGATVLAIHDAIDGGHGLIHE